MTVVREPLTTRIRSWLDAGAPPVEGEAMLIEALLELRVLAAVVELQVIVIRQRDVTIAALRSGVAG